MPRKNRIQSLTDIYHWICRGINKKYLFHNTHIMLIKPNYTKVISDFKSLQSVLIVMILCRAIRVVIYGHPHMKMDPVFGGLSLYGLPYTIDMVLGLIFIIILILEWKLANSCRDAGIISVHPVIIFALMLSLFILFKVNRGIDVGALFFWVTKFQGHTT